MPVGVAAGTETVAVIATGELAVGFTVACGVNTQVASGILGVKLQLRVTL